MKIKFVHADDWEGLYINGKLVLEDHSLLAVDVLDAISLEDCEAYDADEDWLFTRGTLPQDFKDVKVDNALNGK